MPDAEVTEPDSSADATEVPAPGPVFSLYGIASAVLAVVAVAGVVLAGLIYAGHRDQVAELDHRTRVMQAAADWTGVLINMNAATVEASLQRLHDGTVGELNADFEAAVTPYTDVVKTLKSQTRGQIEAVAYESVHRDLDTEPGSPPPSPPLPQDVASRTDTVLVIASSVSQNVGGTPQTVRWNLRLGVSDVDGRLLISRLESMR
ncbi:hypothetical protein [Mycolicibacterium confluentis]|uniref:Uncharacterized protein n=1 Tax=Mycolicibacterium confluentis TaxID=28047 RepID=A0A7I7Y2K5_9MYCO|nr:hypothetical protein [Mycolicibacterium confluentis]MCV7322887.1 hypothetical protein [Mycolicibacterium confluentis]ORV20654.1 hypothetical protein AWB99_06770 [Mycolicibacterium confluentis]BBZ35888.1 hypothetical protein MCNF_44930 [Mycolicibacterium confluentis]